MTAPERGWCDASFDAAVKRHMERPAMYGCDPLSDAATEAALMACHADRAPAVHVQRMPAEACTEIGAEMHHAYRPVGGWAVELAFAVVVLSFTGAFVVIRWLAAP